MAKNVSYDGLLEVVPNKYLLTILAGRRSRELTKHGATPLVKGDKNDTLFKLTLQEIQEKQVSYTLPDDENV